MICEKCQASVPEGKKFCGQCGTPVPAASESSASIRCPGCGNALVPGKKFCGACGRPVQQEEVATPVADFAPVAVPSSAPLPEPPAEPQPPLQTQAHLQPQPQSQVQPEVHVEVEKTDFQNVQVLPAPVVIPKQKSGSTLTVLAIVVIVLLGVGTYFGMQVFSSSAGKAGTQKDTTGVSTSFTSSQSSSAAGGDSQLVADIENVLHDEPALVNEAIRIRVTRGVVTIDGSVSSLAARALAERKVSQVKGVKTLIDNLTLK